jgi:hypothetical protein
MFASMRRYRLQPDLQGEFMRRVDESFADQIAAQAGFVSYELIDCGDGDLFTLSFFLEAGQAERSRDLARRWTEEQLQDIEHVRYDAVHGESVVGRATPGMLEPIHIGDAHKSVSIRLYRLRSGTVPDLLQRVDQVFDGGGLDGFEASHLLNCGNDELLWISSVRDREAADAREGQFVRSELADFRLERVVSIPGEVAVSRANAGLLEPARA